MTEIPETAQRAEVPFDRSIAAEPEKLIRVSPLVRRIIAGNPSPMTFTGTCTYVLGDGEVAIIDPGPDNPDHLAALLGSLRGETVAGIFVTHTHKDHSPGARALQTATGARRYRTRRTRRQASRSRCPARR